MKSTIISSAAFLTAAFAAPTAHPSIYGIQITLLNDHEGAGVPVIITSDGIPRELSKSGGPATATSAQLNTINPEGKFVSCTIATGEYYQVLTSQNSWVDLDNVAGSGPVDLSLATIACYVEQPQQHHEHAKRTEYDLNIELFNDQDGFRDVRLIGSGGYENSIQAVFKGSKVDVNGRIMASAAQLVTVFVEGDRKINCKVTVPGLEQPTHFDNIRSWVDLDGIVGPKVFDLTDGTISCIVEGESIVVPQ